MNTNLSTRKQLRPKSRKPKSDGPPKPDEEKAGKEQNDKEEKNGDKGQTGKEDKTGDKESNGEKSNLLPTTSLSTRVLLFLFVSAKLVRECFSGKVVYCLGNGVRLLELLTDCTVITLLLVAGC